MLPQTAEVMPRDEVAMRSYEPLLLPTKSFPYVGEEVVPVPPLPMPRALSSVSVPICALEEKRFVELAVVEKRFVVVALAMERRLNVEATVVEVAVKVEAVSEPCVVKEPRKSELPRSSKMLPVVVVADCPTKTTLETFDGYTARLSVVVAHALDPPALVRSAAHEGIPPETLSTCPAPPTPRRESVPAPDAYRMSPMV